jgi:hypothetical protein
MTGRGVVAVLAGLGGILMILGGIIGFFAGLANGLVSHSVTLGFGALEYGIAAVVVGLLILVVAGFTHFAGARSKVGEGLLLLILGLVAWFFLAGLLVDIGAVLTALAGLIYLIMGVVR